MCPRVFSALYNNISGWVEQAITLLEIMAVYVMLLVSDLVAYIGCV